MSISFKRFLALGVCTILVVLMMTACNKTKNQPIVDPGELSGTLTFWHFNNDEGPKLAEAFMAKYPNVTINVQITADTDLAYQNKVTSAINAGSGMPDVYVAENAFVKRFVNMSGGFVDLSQEPYNAENYIEETIPYTVDIGRSDDGKIKALSWQACPGGFGYKRDLALLYLGTDDPDEIAKMMDTPENIIETARKVKEASGGKVKLLVGPEDLFKVYVGSRAQSWVENGELTIDPKMLEFIDLAKVLRDEDLEGGIRQWTPAWSAAISDDEHMMWAIPTWGIQWIIAVNDEAGSKGRWGITTPIPFYEGGTWVGISEQSKNKELAWEFVKFLATDVEHLEGWAKETGDFVSNMTIIEKLQNDGDFINETIKENTYQVYGSMVDQIDGGLITQYDDQMRVTFQDYLNAFLAGNIESKEVMIQQFKEQIANDLPNITVK
jgi:ABC-type glycerol-3-phosphate transport system substrate-binding protein